MLIEQYIARAERVKQALKETKSSLRDGKNDSQKALGGWDLCYMATLPG